MKKTSFWGVGIHGPLMAVIKTSFFVEKAYLLLRSLNAGRINPLTRRARFEWRSILVIDSLFERAHIALRDNVRMESCFEVPCVRSALTRSISIAL